jgi:hypothetical protein
MQVKDVMSQEPRKMAGNNAPVLCKTMGVSTANSGDTTNMSKTATCDVCGIELTSKDEYDVYDPETGVTVGIEVVCPNQYKEFHN